VDVGVKHSVVKRISPMFDTGPKFEVGYIVRWYTPTSRQPDARPDVNLRGNLLFGGATIDLTRPRAVSPLHKKPAVRTVWCRRNA
jgi:hypothetical protein